METLQVHMRLQGVWVWWREGFLFFAWRAFLSFVQLYIRYIVQH